MTGMYRATVDYQRERSRAALVSVTRSYESLRNTTSIYAQEHLALIDIYKRVCTAWDEVPDDLTALATQEKTDE